METKSRYRVFVSGEWRPEPVKQFAEVGCQLGLLLAEAGFDLTCGPGSGITKFVLEGYCSVEKGERGKVIFYLPKIREMYRVGEQMYFEPDVVIKTGLDYPSRNVKQVREADALIAITGGSGTITEIVHALDFGKPVAILDQSGPMVDASKALPSIRDRAFFGNSAEELVAYIKEQFRKSEPENQPDTQNPTTHVSL